MLVLLFVVAATCFALHWRMANRGPIYQGRYTSEWVAQALHDNSRSVAFEAVLKIGAPAVPFIASQGLYGRSHTFNFLSEDHVSSFGARHPRLRRWLHLDDWDYCVGRHDQARWLLWCMGTNGQAAVPDVINCLEHCPSLHFVNTLDLLDTLGEISGCNPAAIPYLTKVAHGNGSISLRAATVAYQINAQTNLFIETFFRAAKANPDEVLDSQELFWFRNEHKLNLHLVPLLVKMSSDPQLTSAQRAIAISDLEDRTNDIPIALLQSLKAPAPSPLPPFFGR